MKLALLTVTLALPSAAALEIRGVSPHDLIGALQLPWLEAHCDGCQPDYCYPQYEPVDYECYRKGYPKCCTKDKGNCPTRKDTDCECSGNCEGSSNDVREPDRCQSNGECKATRYCKYAEGRCGDGDGRCEDMPTDCGDDDDDDIEVCGCNGLTYANACETRSVGISISYEGKCGEEKEDTECVFLGEAAAEHIVLDDFCSPTRAANNSRNNSFSRSCRTAAYDVCEKDIAKVAEEWCPDENLKDKKLAKMQDKCEEQVDSMVN